MKSKLVFICMCACACTCNIFAADKESKIVNPKDQTDVYGIPTDLDEFEESQEMQTSPQKDK